MIKAESRGDYDFARKNDALIVSDESGQRIALFVDDRRAELDIIGVAVDMPGGVVTRCYTIDFKWLINHLRKLEPEREASES
jgi:hypothetical protein